jgi:Carboxypeptidase regulatory-like domain
VASDRLRYVTIAARLTWPLVLAGLTVAACGTQQPGAGLPASRVTGTVLAGPITPVARPGVPATRPVPGATVEALRGSEVMAITRTDDAGRYQLTLPPGIYVILAKADSYFSKRKSQTVTVTAGKTLKISFVIDTGIR